MDLIRDTPSIDFGRQQLLPNNLLTRSLEEIVYIFCVNFGFDIIGLL